MTQPHTVLLYKVKETKRTVRYDVDSGDEAAVLAVYIQKTHTPEPHPGVVKLTVDFSKE
ncbi:hypothetical protein LCGC14_0251810 [marine sediment metagenome]|uniref:Uncharacterized protein n=1 Tax=marine sediment metagenome TaxID=412755 RepID=A0A0F9U924_9ZZZZ